MNYFRKPFWNAKRLQLAMEGDYPYHWFSFDIDGDYFRGHVGKFAWCALLKSYHPHYGISASNFAISLHTGLDTRPADQIRVAPFGGGRPMRHRIWFQPWPWSWISRKPVPIPGSVSRPFTVKNTGETVRVHAHRVESTVQYVKWLPFITRTKRHCFIRFDAAVGSGKGSYKGGCTGTYWDMKPGETLAQAVSRCEREFTTK